MGAWGITMRESDDGLDMLDTIVTEQFKAVDFAYLDVAAALELLSQKILEEIKRANRGCTPEELDFYIKANFQRSFTQAALLVAECAADVYRDGVLLVCEYVRPHYTHIEHRVPEVRITPDSKAVLLQELRSVQDSEHKMYRSWFDEETRQEWLAYVRMLQRVLEEQP